MSSVERLNGPVRQEMARSRDGQEKAKPAPPLPPQTSRQKRLGHIATTSHYLQELRQASELSRPIDPDMPAVA